MGKYQTEQKKQLLSFLEEHEQRQYSAEELSEILSDDRDRKAPGKSTVYRLVSELAEQGLLRRFPQSEGRGWTYQYHQSDCGSALHLKCEKCGALLHLDCEKGDDLLRHVEEEHGFKIDNRRTVLFGLCAACRSKEAPPAPCSCPRHA